jgi:hypothetical protein
MPAPAYPTTHKLGTYQLHASKEHAGCVDLDIKAVVMDPTDATKVGWELQLKRWTMEAKATVKLGTSEATVTVEHGFLIVSNAEGEKASLRLPRTIRPDGPVIAVHPDFLVVTLPRADKAAASA